MKKRSAEAICLCAFCIDGIYDQNVGTNKLPDGISVGGYIYLIGLYQNRPDRLRGFRAKIVG